jgi:hypothetical protein
MRPVEADSAAGLAAPKASATANAEKLRDSLASMFENRKNKSA